MHQGSESGLGEGMMMVIFPKIRATPRVCGIRMVRLELDRPDLQ